ncbi:MAG: GtrA family protein [Clostridia bacterium]|nr:GtrA family protein [Clostridia bacterium]
MADKKENVKPEEKQGFIKRMFTKYKEIIMYLIFGVLTTVVSWGSYALFEMMFKAAIIDTEVLVAVANVLSWVAAVLFAYITNKLFVFDSKSFKPTVVFKEMGLFVGSRLISGAVEWVGVPLLVWIGLNQTIFGIEGMVAKVLVSVIVVILNYILSKLLVFKNKKSEK